MCTHVLLCRNESNKSLSCPSVHSSLASAIEAMRSLSDSNVTSLTQKDPAQTYTIRISSSGTERYIDQISVNTTNNLILSNTTTTNIQPIMCYFILPVGIPSPIPPTASTTASSSSSSCSTSSATSTNIPNIIARPLPQTNVVTQQANQAYAEVMTELRKALRTDVGGNNIAIGENVRTR